MSNLNTTQPKSAKQDTSTTNPFRVIVEDLPDTWTKVSIDYLDWISTLLKPYNIPVETYGDIFKVLEYLFDSGAIDLVSEDDHNLIRKRQYFGKNNE